MTFIVDGTNGLTFPNSTIQASGGKTIQVVQGTYSTQTSISTSTQTSTGLTASITPIFSTSKILVLISSLSAITGTGNIYGSPSLYRNSSAIYTSQIVNEFKLNSGTQLTTIFCLNYFCNGSPWFPQALLPAIGKFCYFAGAWQQCGKKDDISREME